MDNYAEVVALVEGSTEQKFIKELLGPYMFNRNIFLTPIIINKPGEKGGDVKFARVKNDIEKHLKQQSNTWVTLMVDFYGIKSDWPGYEESKKEHLHSRKAEVMNDATTKVLIDLFPDHRTETRFLPYVSMHEIEALYFSDSKILAEKLGVKHQEIDKILTECGEPEKINDNSQTAPSKRLIALSRRFKKTSTGLAIARAIGIERMRQTCPIFSAWLTKLEFLTK